MLDGEEPPLVAQVEGEDDTSTSLLDGEEPPLVVQVEGDDDPQGGAPERLRQELQVGVEGAVGPVPREDVVGDAVAHVEQDAVHAWDGKREEESNNKLHVMSLLASVSTIDCFMSLIWLIA